MKFTSNSSNLHRSSKRLWLSLPPIHPRHTGAHQSPYSYHPICPGPIFLTVCTHGNQTLANPLFPVKKGVFQGDTLSPLTFLIAFTSLYRYILPLDIISNFPLTVVPLKRLSHSLKQTATSMHSGTKTPMNPQAGTWPRFSLCFLTGLLPSGTVKATPLRP